MAIDKVAVDSAAKDYWTGYYKEYGKTWVRDIPRKIKKAMAGGTKTANDEGLQGKVAAIGSALTDEAVFLEGLFTATNGSEFAFAAKFDHDGNVVEFDALPLKTASKSKSKSKSK